MHLQRTSYLSSQECVLRDNLIQACDAMNLEALEEVQSRSGPPFFGVGKLETNSQGIDGEDLGEWMCEE